MWLTEKRGTGDWFLCKLYHVISSVATSVTFGAVTFTVWHQPFLFFVLFQFSCMFLGNSSVWFVSSKPKCSFAENIEEFDGEQLQLLDHLLV